MILEPSKRKVAIELLIEKSNRNLQQAQYNADEDYWDLVANRLYFSIFHAINALFIKDEIYAKSHKGIGMLFGQNYIQTGQFSPDDGSFLSLLQSMREKADYQNVFVLSKESGIELINKAINLQKKIINIIKS